MGNPQRSASSHRRERSETVRVGVARKRRLIFSPSPAKAESGARTARQKCRARERPGAPRESAASGLAHSTTPPTADTHRSVGEPAEGSLPRDPNPPSPARLGSPPARQTVGRREPPPSHPAVRGSAPSRMGTARESAPRSSSHTHPTHNTPSDHTGRRCARVGLAPAPHRRHNTITHNFQQRISWLLRR